MTHNPYAHNDDDGKDDDDNGCWWIHPEPQGPPDEPGPEDVEEAPSNVKAKTEDPALRLSREASNAWFNGTENPFPPMLNETSTEYVARLLADGKWFEFWLARERWIADQYLIAVSKTVGRRAAEAHVRRLDLYAAANPLP